MGKKAILDQRQCKLFFSYISERHMIYKRRFVQHRPPPWTSDPVLSKYKFTNVFRDLDPGTRFVKNDILGKLERPEDIIFNIIIYRVYNKIETFKAVGLQRFDHFDKGPFESRLRTLKASGMPVFTNAFVVPSYRWIDPAKDKIANTSTFIENLSGTIKDVISRIMGERDSEYTFKQLLNIEGIGPFLAYQIAVDIGYWNKEVFDESVFVVAGPGCKRGIDFLFGNRGGLSYGQCIEYVRDRQGGFFKQIGIDENLLFDDRKERHLNLMALENCFCEFSKYVRASTSTGRPRNRFVGR